MLMHTVLGGKRFTLGSTVRIKLTNDNRTMAWAIDLDDGGTINALGSDLNRQKSLTIDQSLLDPDVNSTDLGGN
jgi:hypothetical protein